MPNYDKLFTRRSKFYSANIHIWKKIYAAYCGGSKYIKTALIPHVAENKLEFTERANRAIYLNIPRKITDMVTEYLFRSEPDRTNAREDISLDFDRNGMSVNLLMQQAQIINFLFGIAWILVDYPQVSGRIDLDGKQKGRIRPFARVLLPHHVKDWAVGNDGKLLWVLIEEHFEKKDDPFADPVDGIRIRLWTRTDWQLFEKVNSEIKLIANGIHNLGEVPVIRWVNPNGYKLSFTEYAESELDRAEQETIKFFANQGYQLKNKTIGGQGQGKEAIEEHSTKTYRQGVAYGYEKCRKEIKNLFAKYLEVKLKQPENKIKFRKYIEFTEWLKGEQSENKEPDNCQD